MQARETALFNNAPALFLNLRYVLLHRPPPEGHGAMSAVWVVIREYDFVYISVIPAVIIFKLLCVIWHVSDGVLCAHVLWLTACERGYAHAWERCRNRA